MEQFKIRCSAISNIMGIKGLGKTGETYLQTWYKEQVYGRKKSFTSKYTSKGILMEDEAIDFASLHLGLGLAFKNQTEFSNSFLTGTPDVIVGDTILDIKCSWDCFTFPLLETECPNDGYNYQLQGYMALTGAKHAKLVYCLMDAPEDMIVAEAKKECYKAGMDWLDVDIFDGVREQMTYSNLPPHLRLKVFEIERDEMVIDKIKERVEVCRDYLNFITLTI